ncbi:hypothetical protein VRRI112168_20175 [Vreelandella rituensis]
MFIARVSRGRTFREFVMGVLLVPTIITIIWIGLFGGTALYHELFGAGGIIQAVDEEVATALFATINAMDMGIVGTGVSAALVVLIATYLITSANAGTLVINTILSGGDPEPPPFTGSSGARCWACSPPCCCLPGVWRHCSPPSSWPPYPFRLSSY